MEGKPPPPLEGRDLQTGLPLEDDHHTPEGNLSLPISPGPLDPPLADKDPEDQGPQLRQLNPYLPGNPETAHPPAPHPPTPPGHSHLMSCPQKRPKTLPLHPNHPDPQNFPQLLPQELQSEEDPSQTPQ